MKDMLLDQYVPDYEFNEVRSVIVQAAPEKVFAAIKNLTPSELSPMVYWLLSIRDIPARITGKYIRQAKGDQPFLEQLFENNFIRLAEEPNPAHFSDSWIYNWIEITRYLGEIHAPEN